MLCQICKKNEATVHFTEIIEDNVVEMHMCEKCAVQKGISSKYDLPLADMLAGLAGLAPSEPGIKTQTCSNCGLTYEDFARTGKLGCPECYNTFKDTIAELLRKIHGSTIYNGKVPARNKKESGAMGILKKLRSELHKAIEKEEFEEAALLRDEINKITK